MVNEIVHEYADFNLKISAHSIRHAVATHMLKRGANILILQKLLGHSSPKTTQVYTRLYPRDLIQIYRRFHPRTDIRHTKNIDKSKPYGRINSVERSGIDE